jgi:hypothetical protein
VEYIKRFIAFNEPMSEATECIFDVKQKLFTLESEEAKRLTNAIKSKIRPRVFPCIKFSLISQE